MVHFLAFDADNGARLPTAVSWVEGSRYQNPKSEARTFRWHPQKRLSRCGLFCFGNSCLSPGSCARVLGGARQPRRSGAEAVRGAPGRQGGALTVGVGEGDERGGRAVPAQFAIHPSPAFPQRRGGARGAGAGSEAGEAEPRGHDGDARNRARRAPSLARRTGLRVCV